MLQKTHPPNLYPATLIAIGFFTGLMLIGCSTDVPVHPDLNISNQELSDGPDLSQSTTSDRYILGLWHVEIDPETLEYSLTPGREASIHLDITQLLEIPMCPSCLSIKNVILNPGESLQCDVVLDHPVPGNSDLDVFDLKAVILGPPDPVLIQFESGTVSKVLINANGYTSRWAHFPWADINGFIDFETDDPERRFSSGESSESTVKLKLPESGPIQFDFVIDACWLPPENPTLSPHCNEAFDVITHVPGTLNPLPESMVDVWIGFYDWQNDGSLANVSIEIPDLMPIPVPAQFVIENGMTIYSSQISNLNGAGPGIYTGLVCIRDDLNNPENDELATFQLMEITVTDQIPTLLKIEISPNAATLSEPGEQTKFDLTGFYSDGSKSPITEGIDWDITGTDLNGNALANIDQNGHATRESPRWWGGTAIVTAIIESSIYEAILYCEDPFADGVSVQFGVLNEEGDTFTQPGKFLGPPHGAGGSGGLDVCSLGYGGVATLEFIDNVIVDGPGNDLIVFENAFIVNGSGCDWYGDTRYAVANETAIVEVSQDGVEWHRYPFDYNPANESCVTQIYMDTSSFTGLAGNWPTFADVNPDGTLTGGIDPTDPQSGGGNSFDLAEVGLSWCRFVRIIDTGDPDYPGTEQYDSDGDLILCFGNVSPLGAIPNKAGFDGDAVAAVHSASRLSVQ